MRVASASASAADLLGLALGLGADGAQLALHLAENLLAAPLALRAETLGDGLALGDHAALHLLANRLDVVDPLDAHIVQHDAELRHQPPRPLENLLLEQLAAELGLLLEVDVVTRRPG
jgi:hypothetical protein